MKRFGDATRLRELRVRSGFKTREVCDRTGISLSYLSDLELGRRGWTEGVLERLLSVYGARDEGAQMLAMEGRIGGTTVELLRARPRVGRLFELIALRMRTRSDAQIEAEIRAEEELQ